MRPAMRILSHYFELKLLFHFFSSLFFVVVVVVKMNDIELDRLKIVLIELDPLQENVYLNSTNEVEMN